MTPLSEHLLCHARCVGDWLVDWWPEAAILAAILILARHLAAKS